MIHAKLTNIKGDKIEVKIPQSWVEVSMKQLLELLEGGETLKDSEKIAILTQTDALIWQNSTDIVSYQQAMASLSWTNIPPKFDSFRVPSSIKYKDKSYKVPVNLKAHSVAQFEDMRAFINTEMISKADKDGKIPYKASLKGYAYLTAFYLQPIIMPEEPDRETGLTYSYGKAIEFAEEVLKEFSCMEVNAMGGFFLTRLLGFPKNTPNYSPKPKPTIWQKILAFLNFRKITAFSLLFML